MNKEELRAKAILGLPLNARERAYFLLFLATPEEVKWFLKNEKN